MKKISIYIVLFGLIAMAAIFLPGCFKDKCTHTYRIYTPVYRTREEVRNNIKSNSPQAIARPGKLFLRGQYIYLNEIDRGIHIIDNSNPSSPKNVAFIDIPGNMDIAVKGNILYADLYNDLVAVDITDPLHAVRKNIVDDAFPYRRYTNGFMPDTSKIIVNWTSKDTTLVNDCTNNGFGGCPSCSYAMDMSLASSSLSAAAQKAASPFGMGGSMARFSIVNSNLYTVTNSDLGVYSIASPESPAFMKKVDMGWGIETIYPFKDKLFIGSNSGMFIFDISNPGNPAKLGQFSHVTACDPVIADDNYAFVTLSSGNTRCANSANQLEIVNISNLMSPYLTKAYPMTNPHGLSKDGNTLFICDGKDGLKVYDAANVNDIKLVQHIEGFESYDVIAFNKIAILVSKDGLRQYDYSNPAKLKLLSTIGWVN